MNMCSDAVTCMHQRTMKLELLCSQLYPCAVLYDHHMRGMSTLQTHWCFKICRVFNISSINCPVTVYLTKVKSLVIKDGLGCIKILNCFQTEI